MPGVRSTAPNGLAKDGQHRPWKRSRMRERSRASVAPKEGVTAPPLRLVAGKAAVSDFGAQRVQASLAEHAAEPDQRQADQGVGVIPLELLEQRDA